MKKITKTIAMARAWAAEAAQRRACGLPVSDARDRAMAYADRLARMGLCVIAADIVAKLEDAL